MSPQWLPQNLQKRLLLYVLQQLSLFSEIDLPNLEEVSLNNIHLKDVSIDPEKVGKLPGCNLRYGQLASLELNGGVMGGVNIEATGLEMVVAPNLDMEEDVTKSVQLLLAQSTADLATTIMIDAEDLPELEREVENNGTGDTTSAGGASGTATATATATGQSKPSALGGVMQRAVDIALLRLLVKIRDISIKVVAESADFVIKIDEAFMNTVNGTRSINVVGTRIINLKANVNPGDSEGDEGDEEDESASDNDSDSASDSYSDKDDYDSDEAKTPGQKSLMDSMVFTHEEASSIYMSATAQSFRKNLDSSETPKTDPLDSVLLHVNELNFEFEGLSSISNLFVSIDQLSVSCNPLVPTILAVIDSVSRGLKMNMYQRRKQSSTKHPSASKSDEVEKYDDDFQEEEEAEKTESGHTTTENVQFFNRLHVSNIIVSLTSAIHQDGSFAAPKNNLFFSLQNFNIKQKRDTLKYGGIEAFNLIQTDNGEIKKLFEFEPSESEEPLDVPKADIRFELFSKISSDLKVNEFTTLLSKAAHINLNAYAVSNLTELLTSINLINSNIKSLLTNIDSYSRLNSGTDPKNEQGSKSKGTAASQVVLQTSNINLSLELDSISSTKIAVQLLPISFNLLNQILKCQKIGLQFHNSLESFNIGSISNINLSTKSEDFKAYTSHGNTFSRDLIMAASNTFKVSKVNIEISLDMLLGIVKLLGTFGDQVKANPTRYALNSILPATSSTLRMASVYNPKKLRKRVTIDKQKSVCDFRVLLESVTFNLHDVTDSFGNLVTQIDSLQIFKYNGDYNLIIGDMSVTRVLKELRERVMYNYDGSLSPRSFKKSAPLIIGSTRNGIFEVKIRNFIIEYFTQWTKLFDGLKKDEDKETSHLTVVTSGELKKTDIRLQLTDCAIGVTPYQLSCKSVIVINRLNSDLMVGSDKIYAKSTLRDLNLLLIDDTKEIKPVVLENKFSKSPVNWFLKKGFLHIGNVKNFHIGVTYNLDMKTLTEHHSSAYNKAAVFDIKLNVDEVNLETCGDSFHTFTQLLNDLKIPLILSDSEKFKINLGHDIDVFKDIDELSFGSSDSGVNESEDEPGSDTQEHHTDFEIVDEYYDNGKSHQELSDQFEDLKVTDESNNTLEVHDNYFNRVATKDSNKVNPVSVNINVGAFNLYMYDGYDWKQTRQVIKGVVKRVEKESVGEEENGRAGASPDTSEMAEENDELLDVIEETLFQSIHVTLPKGINPNRLASNINRQVNEEEIESNGYKDLKLRRSNKYKMSIELKNIDINMNILSLRDPIKDPITLDNLGDYEVLNEIEVLVDLVTIYDNLINSTWNKYLTYMSSIGEKEIGKNMLKLNIVTSREPMNLNFNETMMKVSILPVRLFIDQDTNEFFGRFFKFNDSRFHLDKLEEDIYLKRFDITNNLKIKIDYKPKNLNLIGLKNGEFNQLLNLININGLLINLNSIKLHGIKGMDNLFVKLFEYWLPNIQQTQLINLFNGVELFKPVINISESFRNFMTLPINDINDLNNPNFYKQLNKSGKEFLKTTSFELLKLGYRLTNGTQTLLEQGEEMLGGTGSKSRKYKPNTNRDRTSSPNSKSTSAGPPNDFDEYQTSTNNLLENSIRLNKNVSMESNMYSSTKKYSEVEDEEYETSDEEIEDSKLISLYSNQPKNFKQGVKLSFKSINKNYNLTKDEFLRLIENVNETNNYDKSIKLLLKRSPLLLLRPMIGTTEILLKTLMGLTNEINSVDQIESRDKYKTED